MHIATDNANRPESGFQASCGQIDENSMNERGIED